MRIFLISTILLVSIQLSCQQNKNHFSPKYSVVLPSNKGEEMMAQCSRSTPQDVAEFFEPDNDEILLLENNFNKLLKMKSTQGGSINMDIEPLNEYGYQHVGLIINNQRYIYINAFLIDILYEQDAFEIIYKDWQTKPIIVCDGGNGFWGVLFDLNTKLFSQLSINGVG